MNYVYTECYSYNTNITILSSSQTSDFTNQKAVFEKDEPKLHLCNAQFEAYSAAWLTTKAHVLEVKSEGFNLTWVPC